MPTDLALSAALIRLHRSYLKTEISYNMMTGWVSWLSIFGPLWYFEIFISFSRSHNSRTFSWCNSFDSISHLIVSLEQASNQFLAVYILDDIQWMCIFKWCQTFKVNSNSHKMHHGFDDKGRYLKTVITRILLMLRFLTCLEIHPRSKLMASLAIFIGNIRNLNIRRKWPYFCLNSFPPCETHLIANEILFKVSYDSPTRLTACLRVWSEL